MYLRSTDLPHYLIARGIVSRESIVEGDFCVTSAVGRHQHFFVQRGRQTPLFIKQITSQRADLKAALRREAACYGLLNTDVRLAQLADVAPKFVDFDPARNALIVQLLTAKENLRDRYRRCGMPSDVLPALGRLLANCHSSGEALTDGSAPEQFPREPARVLSLHRAGSPLPDDSGTGVRQLMPLLLNASSVLAAFDKLHSRWRCETLMHGDMRWENCLADARGDAADGLRFVDWETADVGDAAWDVAGILHSCIAWPSVDGRVAAPADLAQLPPWRDATETFLTSYMASRPLADAEEFLDRCWSYTGVRLIQAAFEFAHVADRLDERAIGLFRAGQGLVLRTGWDTRQFPSLSVP